MRNFIGEMFTKLSTLSNVTYRNPNLFPNNDQNHSNNATRLKQIWLQVNPNLEQKLKTSVKYLHELNHSLLSLSFYRLQLHMTKPKRLLTYNDSALDCQC